MKNQNVDSKAPIIPEGSDFKPFGARRVIVSQKFAHDVYEACARYPSRAIILSRLTKAGFDTDMPGFCLTETLYAYLVNHGCPTEDITLVWCNVSSSGAAEVSDDLKAGQMSLEDLVATGLFQCVGRGIGFSPNFEEQLFEKYPEQSIEEGLQLAGVNPEDVGSNRILRLQKKFDAKLRMQKGPRARLTGQQEKKSTTAVEADPKDVAGQEEQSPEPPIGKLSDEELIATGKFMKGAKGGIVFTPQFEKELYQKFPGQSISDSLKEAGLSVEAVGISRVSRLKAKFNELDGRDPALFSAEHPDGQWHYCKSAMERYAKHPFVKECAEDAITFTESFYNGAAFLTNLSIEEVLSAFSIEPGLFTYNQRQAIYLQLKDRPLIPMEEPSINELGSYPDIMIEILYNRMASLGRSIKEEVRRLVHELPHMSTPLKQSLFHYFAYEINDPEKEYTTSWFIKALEVSRSTFYSLAKPHAEDAPQKLSKEEQDEKDGAAIRRVFEYKGFAKGVRQIYMMLPELEHVHFGLSKIRRLMEKFGMHCDVRKRNPKRQSGKVIQSRAKENLIRRKFRLFRPNQVRLTDVTYLTLKDGKRAYGSAFIDPVTSKLASFNISEKNDLDLVKETIRLSKENPLVRGGIVHTDQGVLYLSLEYQEEIKKLGYVLSMSKRGNCLDNAPMESFWGHFKDEVDISGLSFEQLGVTLEGYEIYYNAERRLWTRERMTPLEYEAYLNGMTAEEFDQYLNREKKKYQDMKKKAAERAINHAKTLGVDGIGTEEVLDGKDDQS